MSDMEKTPLLQQAGGSTERAPRGRSNAYISDATSRTRVVLGLVVAAVLGVYGGVSTLGITPLVAYVWSHPRLVDHSSTFSSTAEKPGDDGVRSVSLGREVTR